MSAGDKAPPKGAPEAGADRRGALEEAVALFDDLHRFLLNHTCVTQIDLNDKERAILDKLESRRAALEPRLARRRETQAKPRGDKS